MVFYSSMLNHVSELGVSCLALSAETEFSLSLNGSELLEDTGQTLASSGIVSGDLIRVIPTQPAAAEAAAAPNRTDGVRGQEQGVAMETNQVSQEERFSDVWWRVTECFDRRWADLTGERRFQRPGPGGVLLGADAVQRDG